MITMLYNWRSIVMFCCEENRLVASSETDTTQVNNEQLARDLDNLKAKCAILRSSIDELGADVS